ncbi:MAG: DUF3015 domain-containing protein [Candidatus Latescibacterota bacterium]|nr:MAG: DUF3015 domain-containing protein [Candidatus Latescibacterota bacterium]
MRKIGALAVAVFCTVALVGVAHAGKSNTGCGIGTLIFEGKEGLLSQVCAATFNGSFGNQTFGITSGTLECEKASTFVAHEKLNKFVGENMDNLAMDISRGNGEYLTTLAVLLDVPVEARPALYGRLQSNFSKIYTSDSVTHIDVLNNIETVLSAS